jgi:hypothetical protein
MKLISPDNTFIYYIYGRLDGKSEGIRFGRSSGACGFVSDTPTAEQRHPVSFAAFDDAVRIPANRDELPPILRNALGAIEREHPEVDALLTGAISFEDALRTGD